jgi:alkyl hydroperoxide reductase subunit AhpC
MYEKMFALQLKKYNQSCLKIFDFEETAVIYSKEFAMITSDQLFKNLIVLFSYSLDFIFFCPTEIAVFNEAHKSFANTVT